MAWIHGRRMQPPLAEEEAGKRRPRSVHTWRCPLDHCVTGPIPDCIFWQALGGGGCEWRPVIKVGATVITPLVDSSLSESLKEERLGDDQENLKERAVQLPST